MNRNSEQFPNETQQVKSKPNQSEKNSHSTTSLLIHSKQLNCRRERILFEKEHKKRRMISSTIKIHSEESIEHRREGIVKVIQLKPYWLKGLREERSEKKESKSEKKRPVNPIKFASSLSIEIPFKLQNEPL